MARSVSVLELTPEEKLQLQCVARRKTGSQRDGLRARIVLRRAEGFRKVDVAEALGVSLSTVSTWSRRFELQGLDDLQDRPGRGGGRPGWRPIRSGAPGAWRQRRECRTRACIASGKTTSSWRCETKTKAVCVACKTRRHPAKDRKGKGSAVPSY
jgi:hypothetical protein